MGPVELVRATRRADTHDEFQRRVADQAARLREDIADRRIDGGYLVGLELEGVAVDDDGRVTAAPDAAFESVCERELGQHNAELNTPPTALDPDGFVEQADEIDSGVARMRRVFDHADYRFVTDGMWTIPPSEGTPTYLDAVEYDGDVALPVNMAPEPRFYALNADITADGPVELDVPGCTRTFRTILVESLTTSIQIHLQVPLDEFVRYFNAALRTAGPVLALSTNSPFLPPDLYDDPRAETVLDGMQELRIPVFESMNVREPGKVRFPNDLERPVDVVDRLVDDRPCAPYLREWVEADARDGFVDEYWELLHKQGTCWRWIRPILGPDGARIEYRPTASQPGIGDVVSFQALVVGLLHGIATTEHPLPELPWTAAKDSFYAAATDGLDADLHWITRDGTQTTDPAVIYDELFALAHRGLQERALDPDHVDELLAPVEARWNARTTPATWKRRRVRDRLDDNEPLTDAITNTQREYIDRSQRSESFATWLE